MGRGSHVAVAPRVATTLWHACDTPWARKQLGIASAIEECYHDRVSLSQHRNSVVIEILCRDKLV